MDLQLSLRLHVCKWNLMRTQPFDYRSHGKLKVLDSGAEQPHISSAALKARPSAAKGFDGSVSTFLTCLGHLVVSPLDT